MFLSRLRSRHLDFFPRADHHKKKKKKEREGNHGVKLWQFWRPVGVSLGHADQSVCACVVYPWNRVIGDASAEAQRGRVFAHVVSTLQVTRQLATLESSLSAAEESVASRCQ